MLEKKILSQLNLPYKMKPTLRTVVQTRYEYKNYDYLISPHRNQYHTSSIPSHLSQTPQILDTHPEESDEQLRDMERKKKKHTADSHCTYGCYIILSFWLTQAVVLVYLFIYFF